MYAWSLQELSTMLKELTSEEAQQLRDGVWYSSINPGTLGNLDVNAPMPLYTTAANEDIITHNLMCIMKAFCQDEVWLDEHVDLIQNQLKSCSYNHLNMMHIAVTLARDEILWGTPVTIDVYNPKLLAKMQENINSDGPKWYTRGAIEWLTWHWVQLCNEWDRTNPTMQGYMQFIAINFIQNAPRPSLKWMQHYIEETQNVFFDVITQTHPIQFCQ